MVLMISLKRRSLGVGGGMGGGGDDRSLLSYSMGLY